MTKDPYSLEFLMAILLESWHRQAQRLLGISVHLTSCLMYSICVSCSWQRTNSFKKTHTPKIRWNVYISKTQGEKCKFLLGGVLFFKVRILKRCFNKSDFSSCIGEKNSNVKNQLQVLMDTLIMAWDSLILILILKILFQQVLIQNIIISILKI